jgi:hypothetical protein
MFLNNNSDWNLIKIMPKSILVLLFCVLIMSGCSQSQQVSPQDEDLSLDSSRSEPSLQERLSQINTLCGNTSDIVCGSDGASYLNSCWATQAGVTIVSQGLCPGTILATKDICEGPIKLVCANNGITYRNECELAQERQTINYFGNCFPRGEGSIMEGTTCEDAISFVCGSNNYSYQNECFATSMNMFSIVSGRCRS